MAPVSRRKDAGCWPRMSSTFWAVVLLTALLLLYCGKCGSERGWTQLLETCARRVTLRCGSGDGTAQQPRLTHRSRSVGVSFFFENAPMGAHPPMISLSHGAWMCLIVSVVWYGASSSPQWFICAFTRAQWHFHPAGGGGGVGAARCQAGLRGETVMHLSPFVLKEGFRVEAIKGRAVWVGWTNRARNFRPGFGCCLRKFGIWGVSPSLFLSLTLSLALLHRLSLCVSAFDSLEESDPAGAQLYPRAKWRRKKAR